MIALGLTRRNATAERALASVRDVLRKGAKALRLSSEPRWRMALRSGVAATVEHDRLPLRRDFRSVIDVGANRGQFALYARVRFPEARIYSLEPLDEPRRRMQTLFQDDERVQVMAKAAGETPGTATLHVSGRDHSSSLLTMAERQTQLYPETAMVGDEDVEVDTLDAMFAKVDLPGPILLKLDVQGCELSALKGAMALLTRVDTVLTEASFVPFYEGQALFDEVHACLTDAGFRLTGGAMSAETAGRWEQGDFVYERPAVAAPQAVPRAAVAAA